MPLQRIVCQRCGAGYHAEDREKNFNFTTAVFPRGSFISPADIVASGALDLLFCPRCPMPFDESMQEGDRVQDLEVE